MMPPYVIRKKITDFVETAAKNPVKGFYPSAAAKYANVSVDVAFKYLLELTEGDTEGALSLKWELRCPEFLCGNVIEVSNNLRSENELLCNKCGSEFDIQESDFYPRFDINPEYRKFINSESKKKQILTLQSR